MQELLDDSSSKSPNRVEAARAGVSALLEKLQAQGINVGDEIDELPDKLLEGFSSSIFEDYLQKILAKLRDLADQIEQSPDTVGQKIDETINSLNKICSLTKKSGWRKRESSSIESQHRMRSQNPLDRLGFPHLLVAI
jgi:ElaB/YqjD/DUF883 family membrane-anchored ribosome-binding protein